MKHLLLTIFAAIIFLSFANNQRAPLAKVEKYKGKYIYCMCEPADSFTYVQHNLKSYLPFMPSGPGDFAHAYINKCLRKNYEFDAIILKENSSAYMINFK